MISSSATFTTLFPEKHRNQWKRLFGIFRFFIPSVSSDHSSSSPGVVPVVHLLLLCNRFPTKPLTVFSSYSEQSRTKCIGLTIETRPDYCLKPHISQMLSYGCTRLEIGVQSVYEDVARDTNRSVHNIFLPPQISFLLTLQVVLCVCFFSM